MTLLPVRRRRGARRRSRTTSPASTRGWPRSPSPSTSPTTSCARSPGATWSPPRTRDDARAAAARSRPPTRSGVALNAVAPARGGDAAKVALARASAARVERAHAGRDGVRARRLRPRLRDGAAAGRRRRRARAGAAAVRERRGRALADRRRRRRQGSAALAWLAVRAAHRKLRTLWERVRQGGAILRTPGRYLRRVALVQAGAWCCRIAVVLCLLAGFGLPASIPVAGVVMVVAGASTLIPLAPGGAGAQQVMVAFALSQTASAAAVVSFSVGMQAGVTAVNALLGLPGGDGGVPHAAAARRHARRARRGARLTSRGKPGPPAVAMPGCGARSPRSRLGACSRPRPSTAPVPAPSRCCPASRTARPGRTSPRAGRRRRAIPCADDPARRPRARRIAPLRAAGSRTAGAALTPVA